MAQTIDRARRQGLAHVIWLGGSPDADKTSIAQIIAHKWGLQIYRFDSIGTN